MSEEQSHVQFEASKEGQRPGAPQPRAPTPRASTPHPTGRSATLANSASERAAATVTDGAEAQNPNSDAATATDDEADPDQPVPFEATWAEHFAKHCKTPRAPRVRPKDIVRCQSPAHQPGGYHYGDYADEATSDQPVPFEATWAEHFAKHCKTRSPRIRPKDIVRCQSSAHQPGDYHYGDYALQADGATVRAARSECTNSPCSRLGSDYFTASDDDADEDSNSCGECAPVEDRRW